MSLSQVWPLFGLRIITPTLVLRLPTDQELAQLSLQAEGNVLEPEQRHHMGPWTQIRGPEFHRGFMQHHWSNRSQFSPDAWWLLLGIYRSSEATPIGCMGMTAQNFPQTRSATSGSWLLPGWRGRGYGKEARAAMLQLLFAGLDGREARSSAHPDNKASLGVSFSLGYAPDGTETLMTADGAHTIQRLLLRREDWTSRPDIQISGLQPCLALMGLEDEAS